MVKSVKPDDAARSNVDVLMPIVANVDYTLMKKINEQIKVEQNVFTKVKILGVGQSPPPSPHCPPLPCRCAGLPLMWLMPIFHACHFPSTIPCIIVRSCMHLIESDLHPTCDHDSNEDSERLHHCATSRKIPLNNIPLSHSTCYRAHARKETRKDCIYATSRKIPLKHSDENI